MEARFFLRTRLRTLLIWTPFAPALSPSLPSPGERGGGDAPAAGQVPPGCSAAGDQPGTECQKNREA